MRGIAPAAGRDLRISGISVVWLAIVCATVQLHAQEYTWEYTVQVSAQVQTNPPAISFSWPQDIATLPDYYAVSRKALDDTAWGPASLLPGSSTSYVDTNVSIGIPYEYQFYKYTSNHVGFGYICSGIQLPMIEDRGKIILLVDDSFSSSLANELTRLQQDLVGDGWTVLRHDVSRYASVPSIKAIVSSDYNADPARVRALFLLGHIPVPYSGDFAPDGHVLDGHLGAWPADCFYGDMDGVWTDTTVNDVLGSPDPRNQNVPGDGKYDQSETPGTVHLEIGRVDVANMPGIDSTGAATFPSEGELLRRYLNKDHNYRHKFFTLPARGLVYNEPGDRGGAAFADDSWRNWAPLLGPPPARPIEMDQFIPILSTNGYLWSDAVSGADHYAMWWLGGTADGWADAGTAADFARNDIKSSFVMLLGSWLGDWDQQDDLMRGVLTTPSYGLASMYAGLPHWFFHYMGIGETIGYCTRLTQNNHANGLYQNQSNSFPGFVHIALMGDPTLRLQTVAPPAAPHALLTPSGVEMSWTASTDHVAGYYVYRAAGAAGPFARLTPSLLSDTNFHDGVDVPANCTYMVRAVKLELSPSGTYYNPSQGVFAPLERRPLLRLNVSGTNVVLTWHSLPGCVYRLLCTDSLVDPNWVSVTDDLLATNALIQATATSAGEVSGTGWVATNSSSAPAGTVVWVEDALPSGAVPGASGEPWVWSSSNPTPYSGAFASLSPATVGLHQHYFTDATTPMTIAPGDVLLAYVNLDPQNVPSEVMLQWFDGTSWEHRAYWGAQLITYGANGSAGNVPMGPLPVPGQWARLAVPADLVNLTGAAVSGMAFTLFNGGASWDYAGKYSPPGPTTPSPHLSLGFSPQRFYMVVPLP